MSSSIEEIISNPSSAFISIYNDAYENQVQKSCVGGGGGVGEETRLDGTCGGGRSPVIYGGQIERWKNKNSESDVVLSVDGFQWMGGHNNQPRFGLKQWDIVGGNGAQGDDDGGGCCHILSAIEIGGKINK